MSLRVKEAALRAERLLPKYGGFVDGAVNQALLLMGYQATRDEFEQVKSLVCTDVVAFTADDPAGLWQAGDLATDLGPESDHPDAPPVRLLRLHADGQLLALTDPFGHGIVVPAESAETPEHFRGGS